MLRAILFRGGTLNSPILASDGTAAAPSYSFASQANTGLYRFGANQAAFSNNSQDLWWADTNLGTRLTTTTFGLGSGPGIAADVHLFRDAANTLAQRNGTNAQAFRVYNTYTDASNYERFGLTWASNKLTLANAAAGTGTLRVFDLGASGQGNVGQIFVDYTNTATVGAVTINKAAGRVNIAAAGTSVVVTNSLVTAASKVFAVIAQNDGTAVLKNVVPAAGSFTITLNAATTAQVAIDFFVVNTD